MSVDKERTFIAPPVGAQIPMIQVNGIMLAVIADLRESHAISFSPRVNSGVFGPAVPGVEIGPGSLVLLVPIEVAAQIRGAMREVERKQVEALGTGQVEHPLADFRQ